SAAASRSSHQHWREASHSLSSAASSPVIALFFSFLYRRLVSSTNGSSSAGGKFSQLASCLSCTASRLSVPLAKEFANDSASPGGKLLSLSRIASADSSTRCSPCVAY